MCLTKDEMAILTAIRENKEKLLDAKKFIEDNKKQQNDSK